MKWIKIDIPLPPDDSLTQLKINGKNLCLVIQGDKVHVVQNTCPHAGGQLSGGWCKQGNLVCPIHRYEYNLETGRGAEGQGDYINVYPTEVRDDGVYVGFKERLLERFFRR